MVAGCPSGASVSSRLSRVDQRPRAASGLGELRPGQPPGGCVGLLERQVAAWVLRKEGSGSHWWLHNTRGKDFSKGFRFDKSDLAGLLFLLRTN